MMETKYEVGDRVRVREDLIVGKIYSMELCENIRDSFVSSMEDATGMTATIKEITESGKYVIDISEYYWTDGMLEPIEQNKPEFKVGDIVRVIGDKIYRHHLKIGSYGFVQDIKDFDARGFYDVEVQGVHRECSERVISQTLASCDLERVDLSLALRKQR